MQAWMCAATGYLPVSWLADPVPTTSQLPPFQGVSSDERVGLGDTVGIAVAAGIAHLSLR